MLCAIVLTAVLSAEWQRPEVALARAAADAEQHVDDAPYLEYIWNPSADKRVSRFVSETLNSCVADLKVSAVMRPVMIDDGHVWRVDIRTLGDPVKIRKIFDEFATDVRLYSRARPAVVLTADPKATPAGAIAVANDTDLRSGTDVIGKIPKGTSVKVIKTETREGVSWNQVEYLGKTGWIQAVGLPVVAKSSGKVTFGAHLSDEALAFGVALQDLTKADVPLVEANEFVRRLNADIGDGVYSKSLGIPSDYDEFLRLFGVDLKVIAASESERRAAMTWSKVTRSQRAISFLPMLAAPVDSPRLHVITEDVGKEDNGVANSPIRQLVEGYAFKAGEAMTTRLNGGVIWSLWAFKDGKGTLQKEVPPDIAANNHISPEDRRLQSRLSCLECHLGKEGDEVHDGWRSWDNDARDLLTAVYADKKSKLVDFALLTKLRNRYDWEPGPSLREWRLAYSVFVAKCDPFEPGEKGKQTPSEFGDDLRSWTSEYIEGPVTSFRACEELGLKPVDEKTAWKTLEENLLPLEDGVEDPLLLLLQMPGNRRLTRVDWNAIWPAAHERLKPQKVEARRITDEDSG